MTSHPARALNRLRCARTNPHRRMRLLHRRRHDVDALHLVMLARVREVALRPCAAQHLDPFLEASRAGLALDSIAGELARSIALPEAQVEPAIGNDVDSGRVL